tara:strand:+ start:899 stop:1315 length:417 start_codon:yes stop_codon:yes gene_type:complete
VIIAGCSSPTGDVVKDTYKEVIVYKSATCGCCVGYVAELKRQGFKVKTINLENMDSIKLKYNIPRHMQSCHTSIIGDYFIEGHVPIEAVNKLLSERPSIDGIALPNMPAGSPGMPGTKRGLWKIYGLKDGVDSEFMKI